MENGAMQFILWPDRTEKALWINEWVQPLRLAIPKSLEIISA